MIIEIVGHCSSGRRRNIKGREEEREKSGMGVIDFERKIQGDHKNTSFDTKRLAKDNSIISFGTGGERENTIK